MSVKIIAQLNPFSTQKTEFNVPSGTIKEIIKNIDTLGAVNTGWRVIRNDQIITNFSERAEDNDILYVKVVPEGDNKEIGTGEKIGGAALVAGGLALSVFTSGIGAGIGAAMIGAGVGLFAGGMVMYNMDLAVQERQKPESDPSIRGSRNQIRPLGYIPILLGRRRIYVDQACYAYTWIDSHGNQYLYQLFCAGQSNMVIDTSSIKIDETFITAYSSTGDINKILSGQDGTLSMQVSSGGEIPPLVTNCVHEDMLNTLLKNESDGVDGSIIRTTPAGTQEINVDIFFNAGLGKYRDDGTIENVSVTVSAWYKNADAPDSTYQLLGYFSDDSNVITGNELKTKRYSITKSNLPAGSYTVKVTRESADSNDNKVIDQVYVGSIRSIKYESPITAARCRELTLIGFVIKTTEKLNAIVDKLNFIAQSKLPVYSGTGSGRIAWNEAVSSNPASAAIYAMQSELTQQRLLNSEIDFPAFERLYTWCSEHGYECNAYITEGITIQNLLSSIAATCRAEILRMNGKITVIQDVAQDTPMQLFTPRNSWGYKEQIGFAEIPDAIRLDFDDAEAGYTKNELTVYNTADGNKEIEPDITQDVQLWGVTNSVQARKLGMYKYAVSKNRPLVHTFSADFEYLMCQKGDLIEYAGDIALAGISQGRIIELLSDDGVYYTGFSADEEFAMEAGKNYAVRIRKDDGLILMLNLITIPGKSRKVLFDSPISQSAGIKSGDLFAFGTQQNESIQLIVTAIQPGDNLTAELVCVEYSPEIFGVDDPDFILPDFVNKITPQTGEGDNGKVNRNELLEKKVNFLMSSIARVSDLYSNHIVTLYKETEQELTATGITSNLVYSFADNSISWIDENGSNGWSLFRPVSGNTPIWVTAATAFGKGASDIIVPTEWATPYAYNGRSATTVVLNNENITIACDSQGKINSAFSVDVKISAYSGAKKTACTITKKSSTSNVTVSNITNGTASQDGSLSLSVPSGTSVTPGTITLEITAAGISFEKRINLNITKNGAKGDKGNTGNTGAKGDKGDAAVTYEVDMPMTYKPGESLSLYFYKIIGNQRSAISVYHDVEYTSNGTTWTAFPGSKTTGTSFTTPAINAAKKVRCIIKDSSSSSVILDEEYAVLVTDGANGINTATIVLYKRLATKPQTLPGTIKYRFDDASLAGNFNGWSTSIPEVQADKAPCWETHATASSSTVTDDVSEWTEPVKITQDGLSQDDVLSLITETIDESPNIYANPTTGIFAIDVDGVVPIAQSVDIAVKVIKHNTEIDFVFGNMELPEGITATAQGNVLTFTALEGARLSPAYIEVPIEFISYQNYDYLADTEGNPFVWLTCEKGYYYGTYNQTSALPASPKKDGWFQWTGINETSTEEVVEGGVFKKDFFYTYNGVRWEAAQFLPLGIETEPKEGNVYKFTFTISTVEGGVYAGPVSSISNIPLKPIIGDFFTWVGTDQTVCEGIQFGKLLSGCCYKWDGKQWLKDTAGKHLGEAMGDILNVAEAEIAANNSEITSWVRKIVAWDVVTQNLKVTGTAIANAMVSAKIILGKASDENAFFQSWNFSDVNKTGFLLKADGKAILNDIIARGDIYAKSLTLSESASIPYGKIADKPNLMTFGTTKGGNFTLLTVQPNDWNSKWKTYFKQSNNMFLPLGSLYSSCPDFSANTFYKGTGTMFEVSTNGLLVANNAVITGTVYATDGFFNGLLSTDKVCTARGFNFCPQEPGNVVFDTFLINAWNVSSANAKGRSLYFPFHGTVRLNITLIGDDDGGGTAQIYTGAGFYKNILFEHSVGADETYTQTLDLTVAEAFEYKFWVYGAKFNVAVCLSESNELMHYLYVMFNNIYSLIEG